MYLLLILWPLLLLVLSGDEDIAEEEAEEPRSFSCCCFFFFWFRGLFRGLLVEDQGLLGRPLSSLATDIRRLCPCRQVVPLAGGSMGSFGMRV